MRHILLLSLFVSMNVFSADSSKKMAMSNESKMKELGRIDEKTLNLEPAGKNDEAADHSALVADPKKVKFNLTCRTKDGKELKQREAEYDECLQQLKNDKNSATPGAAVKINFGE